MSEPQEPYELAQQRKTDDFIAICQDLREHKILLIARGTFFEPFLATLDVLAEQELPRDHDLYQKILRPETASKLYMAALRHDAMLCVDVEEHQSSWRWQDCDICAACREIRDIYFSDIADNFPAKQIDLRKSPEAKLLPFVRKKAEDEDS